MKEYREKQACLQELLEKHKLDAILLRRASSFAWATCGGASYVNITDDKGAAQLLFAKTGRYAITNNIEAARLIQEEKLTRQRWEVIAPRWYEPEDPLVRLTKGLTVGADIFLPGYVDLSADMTRLRTNLTESEINRFRKLGKLCAQAMEAAIQSVRPEQSERRISARLAYETEKRGVQAIVNLIATDERIFSFRHPLPTEKKLDHYAMLVLCGRKWGLVCSLTRFVHFGSLPDDLHRKAQAVAKVDATFIANTLRGQKPADIFQAGVAAYAESGYPDEWHLHHQGGLTGYEPREVVATSHSEEVVSAWQVYAWNPSITGTKSEDTILITDRGIENITVIRDWPTIPIYINDRAILRPAILERD